MDAATLSGLTKTFRGLAAPALSDVSGTVRSGVVTGVAGPDGAGKTTLMRLMAGLLRPDGGSLTVLGRDPCARGGNLRLRVGYMPQKFGLYEDLSVLENLELYADLRNVTGAARAESFERMLAFTDLARFTERHAGKLSGGMKQKLGLACALLGAPRVLLLDEPGVGVDPISRRELWRMVRALAADGLTILWSTAYLDEAERCDEVRLMNAGRILASGPPRTLMDAMRGRCLHVARLQGHRTGRVGDDALQDAAHFGHEDQFVGLQGDGCAGGHVFHAQVERFTGVRKPERREHHQGTGVDGAAHGHSIDFANQTGVHEVHAVHDADGAGCDEVTGDQADGRASHGRVR